MATNFPLPSASPWRDPATSQVWVHNGAAWIRQSSTKGIGEAPLDGNGYFRMNGKWQPVAADRWYLGAHDEQPINGNPKPILVEVIPGETINTSVIVSSDIATGDISNTPATPVEGSYTIVSSTVKVMSLTEIYDAVYNGAADTPIYFVKVSTSSAIPVLTRTVLGEALNIAGSSASSGTQEILQIDVVLSSGVSFKAYAIVPENYSYDSTRGVIFIGDTVAAPETVYPIEYVIKVILEDNGYFVDGSSPTNPVTDPVIVPTDDNTDPTYVYQYQGYDPLEAGMVYFDTVRQAMMSYDGATWRPFNVAINTTIQKEFAWEITGGDHGAGIPLPWPDTYGNEEPRWVVNETQLIVAIDGVLQLQNSNPGAITGDFDVDYSANTITFIGSIPDTSIVTCFQAGIEALVSKDEEDISEAAWVVDEDDMASNSDTKLPTQQSVRAYVLSQASEHISGRKNLLINSDFQINSRAFGGSWASLNQNDFGYDMWSTPHINGSYYNNFVIQQYVPRQMFVPNAEYTLHCSEASLGYNSYIVDSTGAQQGTSKDFPITCVPNPTGGVNNIIVGIGQNAAIGSDPNFWVQLERGSVPTTRETRSITAELLDCQSHYFEFATGIAYTYLCDAIIAPPLSPPDVAAVKFILPSGAPIPEWMSSPAEDYTITLYNHLAAVINDSWVDIHPAATQTEITPHYVMNNVVYADHTSTGNFSNTIHTRVPIYSYSADAKITVERRLPWQVLTGA